MMKSYFKPYRLIQAFLVMVGVYCYQISYSQTVQNVDFAVSNNQVIVTYDLVGCPDYKSYDIKLYYSEGNRYSEATSVMGSLYKQSCGRYKSITWDVLNDRDELKGNVQVEVRIAKTYSTKPPLPIDNGYFGVLIGGFGPIGSFSATPVGFPSDDLKKGGFNADLSYTRRYWRFIGITSSLRSLFSVQDSDSDDTAWFNVGFTIGPLISFPLSEKIVWDIRPMIGYSQTFVTGWSQSSVFYNGDYSFVNAGSLTTNIGTVLRFNTSHVYNWHIGADYYLTNPQFNSNITRNIKTLGVSVGIGKRFN